ncbi:MAG: FliI/YscN family ATPase [Deltaproteobacteria bacterium]|nr:FliI/YscN family ATPase [Deltaproteobacteria bacterium]MBN2673708.1 FliI/YscN family ATPase [Deltaproteobacteria bacterium]
MNLSLNSHDSQLITHMKELASLKLEGQVSAIVGPVVKVKGLRASVGQHVDLWPPGATRPISAEAIGLDEEQTLCMAYASLEGVSIGCNASLRNADALVPVGDALLGRIVDAHGRPLDDKPLTLNERQSLRGTPPSPMTRNRIDQILETGVRVLDSMLTLGQGQRVGIYAGAGVGKTTLLSMLTMHGDFDVCVIGLIGERGREVREFVEDAVTDHNRARTCVVAVTGDQAPLTRTRGALYATAIAEYFREKGRRVVLLLDSLTRYAMALREVGLAGGELPATKGYPPSVFVELARLLERAGNSKNGSITGIYTVLVEGDDMSDPVADSTRALLDGHIVLSRDYSNRGIFPAVDVLSSKSRLITQLASPENLDTTRRAGGLLSDYYQAEDLIKIGAYQKGSDSAIDRAILFMPQFLNFISQPQATKATYAEATAQLGELVTKIEGAKVKPQKRRN